MDPLGSSDSRQNNPQKNQALLLASHQSQKKYDLLEEDLLGMYQEASDKKLLIGQLFTLLDLAEFYTFGFINYQKALTLYSDAELLNEKLSRSGYTADRVGGEIITYYRASGKYVVARTFNHEKISNRIISSRKRINRFFRHQSDQLTTSVTLPAVTSQVTANYAFAINVDRDLLNPIYFDQFEEKITKITRDYFKRRYKLPRTEHPYYISFNILHGLVTVFDFSSLSQKQIQRIYTHLNNAKMSQVGISNELQDAYLDFVEVLCLTELGEAKMALSILGDFQRKIDKINNDLLVCIQSMQDARDAAVTANIVKNVGFLALTILTMGQAASGGGFYINLSPAGIMDYAGSVLTLQRQLKFTGESTYSKSWNILLDINDQLQLFRAAGKLYHLAGDLKNSIKYNREAVEIIANMRSTITTEEGRVSFAAYKDQVYGYLIEDLFRSKKFEESFYYAENYRARALVDLLGSKANLSFGGNSINAYAEKLRNIQIYRDQLRGNVAVSNEQVAYIKNMEENLAPKMFNTSRGLSFSAKAPKQSSSPTNHKTGEGNGSFKELLTLITVSNLDYLEIQKLLPADSTLVEYYVVDDHIYVWILTNNSFMPVSLNINRESTRREVLSFVQGVKSGLGVDNKSFQQGSTKLYQTLFKPLEAYIKTDSIYLVSHDFLHFLPFDALHTGKKYLVEKYAFSSLPSSSVLRFLEPLDYSKKSLLLLGNPSIPKSTHLADLPGAEKEVRRIAAYFAEKKLLIKDKATETSFRNESANATISHVASHGRFDERDALNSKLYLAADDKNDGQLTAKEVFEIPKVSNMVVLSACETARAKICRGDEMLGFIRSFFFSGASSLIASLWIVDDNGTLRLMDSFYRHLIKENEPPLIALQKAKKDMISSDLYQVPFYWSAFNLYGLGI